MLQVDCSLEFYQPGMVTFHIRCSYINGDTDESFLLFINPSHDAFIFRNIKIYFHFLSFSSTEMVEIVNSSPRSTAYMSQSISTALVQIMARRLFGTKPLSKPMWVIVNWTLWNKLQWHVNQNTNFFTYKNASEYIVCEMVAILSRERWVKILPDGNKDLFVYLA